MQRPNQQPATSNLVSRMFGVPAWPNQHPNHQWATLSAELGVAFADLVGLVFSGCAGRDDEGADEQ